MKGTLKTTEPGAEIAQPKKSGVLIRRIFNILGIVACVILIPIFICNLILTVKGYANKDEIPSLFSLSPMYVLTGSMSPAIDPGDLIILKKVSAEKIAKNDVIIFTDPVEPDTMITHRVEEIVIDEEGSLFFLTQGDANDSADPIAIPAENLIGKYLFRLRGMGNVAMFMQSFEGLVLCFSIPLVLLVGGEMFRLLYNSKKEE